MKNIKPFGPSIGKTKISKKFSDKLNNEFDIKSNSKKIDYSSKLASQIKNEVKISNSFIKNYLEKELIKKINEFLNYWPLFVCVLIGGQIGNLLNIKFLSNKTLTIVTSMLVIFVSVRMGIRLIP